MEEGAKPLGVPTWSLDGVICTGKTHMGKVKLTFAKGASLDDPDELFNASLNANVCERLASQRPPRRRQGQRLRLPSARPSSSSAQRVLDHLTQRAE
jgi:hypothetical protein